jgi:hypothetical protein
MYSESVLVARFPCDWAQTRQVPYAIQKLKPALESRYRFSLLTLALTGDGGSFLTADAQPLR